MTRARRGHVPYRVRRATLRDGRTVTLRAVRPEDAGEIVQAFERLSAQSRYQRFMQHKRELDPHALARGVSPVPGREFALVATVPAYDGYDIVGAARYVASAQPKTCEFSITVAEDWRGAGLATTLLRRLILRARRDGYRAIEGFVLADNLPMLALARYLGFAVLPVPDDTTVCLVRRAL
jgi:RimJ/RimL family protein N-acetyltransferase